jgi:myb proto-oncogene protein
LPGRTDNEIKNYWRTRVQKQARQLRVDANSSVFRDAVRCYWMPRLLEKMAAATATSAHPHQVDSALLHPAAAHISGGMAASAGASSPVHGGGHHDAANNSAPGSSGGYGHHVPQRYPVDPSPSTSTSGSGSTSAAALPPVPCFSELTWADQYGPYAADLDGGAFDAAALGSLGLDALDLGPADSDLYSDSTLLDYLNSTCCAGGSGAMMATMIGSGVVGNAANNSCGGAMGVDNCGDYYGLSSSSSWRADELCQAAARKLGDHQWGGGI